MVSTKRPILAFTAGFLATVIFHQGLVALLYHFRVLPSVPFNMMPTKPFGIPAVISLSFFGGLWGVLIWQFIFTETPTRQLIKSIIFGAIGPTAVAFFIVFPLKGMTVPMTFLPIGLLLNGAWGLGLWIFMKLSTYFVKS